MLPRRLLNHVRNQNWTAITVELLVVILGVFIGLQVDNWNQSRIENNDARSYYDRLIEDYAPTLLPFKPARTTTRTYKSMDRARLIPCGDHRTLRQHSF